LVVNQVNKAYNCPQMWAYVEEVQKLERHFDGIKLEHIPRGKNIIADGLSQIASKRLPVLVGVFVEWLTKPSATPKVVVGAPATIRRQGSAPPAQGKGHVPDPVVTLAERVTPPWAEELLQYLKY
jgi:hypothetical protein